MTAQNRLVELAGIQVEGIMSTEDFASRPLSERMKLLWQWSTSKQMDFAEWKMYLIEHVVKTAVQ